MPADLTVEIFETGTTRIQDAASDLKKIENVVVSTGYPGGLYLGATMDVPRDIVKGWLIKGAQRMRVLNGIKVVWEGQITNLERALTSDTEKIQIVGTGYWGSLLSSRRLARLYADQRTSADVWIDRSGNDWHVNQTTYRRYDDLNSENLLRVMPNNGVAWGANDRTRLDFIAPAGEDIRRMDFDAQLDEQGQNWSIRVRHGVSETALYTRSTDGTDSNQNVEPAQPCPNLRFHLTANAGQTVAEGVFGELRNITVYATMNHSPASLATVNLTEIAKDIRAEYSDLSTDEQLIDDNTLALKPFVAARYPTVADVLSRASSYGDSSQNRWATGVRGSHEANDNLPILFAEQYPDLTTGAAEYLVSIDEPNMVPPFNINEGYIGSDENRVWNFIIVEFSDERGFTSFHTPTDDVLLKDDDSITDFGQRDFKLSIGHATPTTALTAGRRFLKAHKDPVWSMKGPIAIKGYVRGDKGQRIPAAEIQAGNRLKIENFLRDPTINAVELVFLVTKTTYVDEENVCNLTVGVPNSLDVYLAQRELVDERLLG
jgi:hypothetical protein